MARQPTRKPVRRAAIIEDAGTCTVKNLDTREEQKNVPLDDLGRRVSGRA